jgi:hypothetical protein
MELEYEVWHRFSWGGGYSHSHGSFTSWEEADEMRRIVQKGFGNEDDDVWIVAEKVKNPELLEEKEAMPAPKEEPSEQERDLIHSLVSLMSAAGTTLAKWGVLSEKDRYEFVMEGYRLHKEFYKL